MHEEDVGNPDLLHQATVKGHTLVGAAAEGETLVLPVVSQVQSHGEVLVEHTQLLTRARDRLLH